MLYVTSLVLTFLITTRLYLLIAFIQFPLPQSPAWQPHIWFFFFLNLFIFEVSLPYNTLLVSLVQHSDSVFLYISKMITAVKSSYHLSPREDTTEWWTGFATLYISYSWLMYFATGSLCLFCSLTYFSPPPRLTSVTICLFSESLTVGLFSLDSTYKWNHTVFVSLHLMYFTKPNTSKSIHAVANGRISFFFFYYWVILHMCVSISIYSEIYIASSLSSLLSMGTWTASISWLL